MMNICDIYSYENARGILFERDILAEIEKVFHIDTVQFKKGGSVSIREEISNRFNSLGWADKVRIKSNSNLRISYLKKKVGVCVQLGNVSRTYADLMKLMYLGKVKKIEVGVIAVPGNLEANLLGQNVANFERLVREVKIFTKLIDIPLLVICLGN